jgi:hypothetical protein
LDGTEIETWIENERGNFVRESETYHCVVGIYNSTYFWTARHKGECGVGDCASIEDGKRQADQWIFDQEKIIGMFEVGLVGMCSCTLVTAEDVIEHIREIYLEDGLNDGDVLTIKPIKMSRAQLGNMPEWGGP